MKSWMWVLGGGVIVVIIAALFMLRPSAVVAPEVTTQATPTYSPGKQFLDELEPDAISPSVSPTTSTSAKTAAATISITDTAFSPATISIGVGDTVTFINNGQAQHWPASDPHPTHTGYPGFDAKRALETGDTYNFTFTKAGSWGFHDHLNPTLRGTVVVK